MRDFLRSYGKLRALDPEKGTIEAVISTGNIARDQMIIDPEGWDFTNYRLNPVVLWGHDDGAMPLAKTVDIQASPNELRAKAEFDLEDPMAQQVMGKIARGFINSTSVRWLPKRWENRMLPTEKGEREVLVFTEHELLEWSFVTIPSDPGAVILRSDGGAFDPAVLKPETRDDRAAFTSDDLKTFLTTLSDEERADVLRDYLPVVTEPVSTGVDVAAGIGAIVARMEALATVPDIEGMVVRGLAKATGKTEERVRAELAGGAQ